MSQTSSRSQSPETDIFSLTTALVPERENKPAATSRVDFDGLLERPISLHEDLKEGCGGQLWPAGMVLSKYMLKYHRNLSHQRILELGAGGGLVGLAVAQGCVNVGQILITDQIPMLALMKKNIELNKLEKKVKAAVYDWGTTPPSDIAVFGHADVILAADCVYFEPAFPLLLQTLQDVIQPNTICYFCFKKRRKADMRFIRDMIKKFHVEKTDYEDAQADQRDGVWLYTLHHKTWSPSMKG